jgi:succinoglycan biosynthesis transport protein ExoP
MNSKAPVPQAASVSPFTILRSLWKHLRLIVLIALAGTVLTIAVVQFLPPVYKAEALVLVESQRIPENYVAATVHSNLESRLNILRQQILSYSRLVQVIEKYDLYRGDRNFRPMEEIVEQMRLDITITIQRGLVPVPGRQTPLTSFAVGYQGSNPDIVPQVANLVASYFIDEDLRTREVEAVGTSEFLDSQLAEAKKRLEEQEKQLSAFKLRYSGELPQQENALISSIAQVRTQLTGVQDSMNRIQQNKLMAQTSLDAAEAQQTMLQRLSNPEAAAASPSSTTPVAPLTLPAAAAPAPQLESERLQQQLDNLRTRYSDSHPDVRRISTALTRALEIEARSARPAAVPAPRPGAAAPVPASPAAQQAAQANTRLVDAAVAASERIPALRAQITGWDRELAGLERERQNLLRELGNLQARINRLPLREQELASVTRDYENTRTNYRSLLDKKMAADTATDMERRQKAERFVLLEMARRPERPIKPKKAVFNAAGSMFSLALAFAIALGVETKRGLFLGEWELPPGVTVLGRVPRIVPQLESQAGFAPASRRWRWVAVAALLGLALCAVGAAFYFNWLVL